MGRVRAKVGVLMLSAFCLCVSACREILPTTAWLQPRHAPLRNPSTADARRAFDHRSHGHVFSERSIACVDCHQFALRIESDDEDLARTLSALALRPGSEACHTCHLPGAERVASAPQRCRDCHTNLWPLIPDDHHAGWQRAHAIAARIDTARCEDCHRQQECADCHARRDSIDTRVHERSFRFFHSVAARANPMECGSCHRPDYCISCHEASRVERSW